MSYRADSVEIRGFKVTSQGFLNVTGRITRTGVQDYKDRKELRPEEEVLSPKAMASLIGLPVTWNHVYPGITADNYRYLQEGYVAGLPEVEVTESGEKIIKVENIIIQGSKLIEEITSGRMKQFSASYDVEEDEESPGVYKGERYDTVQRGIVYNHLAVVTEGKCGEDCCIVTKNDSVEVEEKFDTKETKEEPAMAGELKEKVEDEEDGMPKWAEKLMARIEKLESSRKNDEGEEEEEEGEDEEDEGEDDEDEDMKKNDKKKNDKKKSRKNDSVNRTIQNFRFDSAEGPVGGNKTLSPFVTEFETVPGLRRPLI